jgi:hypothetical protein
VKLVGLVEYFVKITMETSTRFAPSVFPKRIQNLQFFHVCFNS